VIGLFLNNGNFFGFESRLWIPLGPVPFDEYYPIAHFQFEGKPTFFGVCSGCAPNFEQMVDIMQFQPDDDRWDIIGQTLLPRYLHYVVEMPTSICDLL